MMLGSINVAWGPTNSYSGEIVRGMFAQAVTCALCCLGLDRRGTHPHPRPPAPLLLRETDVMLPAPMGRIGSRWDGCGIRAVKVSR